MNQSTLMIEEGLCASYLCFEASGWSLAPSRTDDRQTRERLSFFTVSVRYIVVEDAPERIARDAYHHNRTGTPAYLMSAKS